MAGIGNGFHGETIASRFELFVDLRKRSKKHFFPYLAIKQVVRMVIHLNSSRVAGVLLDRKSRNLFWNSSGLVLFSNSGTLPLWS